MKKGFTMIELIFVIVILGILASVAIPRLAATREDAEISAALSNLRTLVSDANAYYLAKGSFAGTNWRDFTNVPLQLGTNVPIHSGKSLVDLVYLGVSGKNCIKVKIVNAMGARPAYFIFGKDSGHSLKGACKKVADADLVKAYLSSTVSYNDGKKQVNVPNAMAIGSSTTIY